MKREKALGFLVYRLFSRCSELRERTEADWKALSVPMRDFYCQEGIFLQDEYKAIDKRCEFCNELGVVARVDENNEIHNICETHERFFREKQK